MCSEIIKKIDSALFGSVFNLKKANKEVAKKIAECEIDQFENDKCLKHSTADLGGMLTLSIQRLERIENKAMGTLLGVGVAIAVFGTTSGILGDDGLLAGQSTIIRNVAAVGLLLAMLYLFGSGLLALGAYKIGQIYRPTLSDQAPVAEQSMAARVILYSIEQNQRAATLRSNKLSASFACLRNGLLVVLMLGVLMVFVGIFSREQNECPTRGSTQTGLPAALSIDKPAG